jgi:hypothetical protein
MKHVPTIDKRFSITINYFCQIPHQIEMIKNYIFISVNYLTLPIKLQIKCLVILQLSIKYLEKYIDLSKIKNLN